MKCADFPKVMVAIGVHRTLPEVLRAIVTGIAACPNVALARIWLLNGGDLCETCRFRKECPDQTRCLHLVASAGNATDPAVDLTRIDGSFRRFPLGVRKIGSVGASGQAIFLPDVQGDEDWIANPAWFRSAKVRTFAAQPLVFRGEVLGVLAIFDRAVLDDADFEWLRIFADHAAVSIANANAFEEIEFLRARLEEENVHLREDFQDLFEEAPIAYVHEGLDSRFIRANRAALDTLGIKPEEIAGTSGSSLVVDTPDAQRRLKLALDAMGKGNVTGEVVLELRRKDNGKPVWVQWWSRPARDGSYTRTMMVDITDRILMEQDHARLEAQNEYLLEEIRSAQNLGDIIGESPAVRKLMHQIRLVAPTDAAVLITGESGTGKELVARAIHENSPRQGRALIKVNCGAVPETLFESEFFGHMRGAFTGAVRDKPGRFELADGGTIFLDEIGEVPLPMQAKLLRVLQEQEIERVGDTRVRKINVRIIAATNRDLNAEVESGRFRQDLFYRLSVFPIENPPLRERREDIPRLADHFIRTAAKRMGRPPPKLTQAAARELSTHDWPGNVRELQNAVERAVILAQGGPLQFDPPPSTRSLSASAPQITDGLPLITRSELKQRERESITAALAQTGGKVSGPDGGAALLGMKPTTLASRMKALGLERGAFKK